MRGRKILIVEDEVLLAWMVEEALLEAGCEVCGIAPSEAMGLMLGKSTRPEFAIVDIQLSRGDGRVVAKELNARFGTAVLFATTRNCNPTDLINWGGIGYLPKPYLPHELLAALIAVRDMVSGIHPSSLPPGMIALRENMFRSGDPHRQEFD